jgi:hypothetical protein
LDIQQAAPLFRQEFIQWSVAIFLVLQEIPIAIDHRHDDFVLQLFHLRSPFLGIKKASLHRLTSTTLVIIIVHIFVNISRYAVESVVRKPQNQYVNDVAS